MANVDEGIMSETVSCRYVVARESHSSVKSLGQQFTTPSHSDTGYDNSPCDERPLSHEDSAGSLSMFDFSLPFSRSNSATVPLITAACSPAPVVSPPSVYHPPAHQGLFSRCQYLCSWRSYIPCSYRKECIELLSTTWPIVVTQLLQFSLQLTGAVFCAHLGEKYLDAVAIGNMVLNTAGMSVLIGLACACDTLFTQMFGTENKKQMGVIFQRSVLVLLLSCIPCWAVLINTEYLLSLIGQEEHISRLAGQFVMASLPVLPGEALQLVCVKYLQSQRIVIPSMMIFFVVNLINFGLHAVLIYGFRLGVSGSGISLSVSYWLLFLLHLFFIKISRVYEDTWQGWGNQCLQQWGQFFRLALPGLVMICLQWWCFEIFTFLAGLLSEEELGAHAIVYQLSSFIYMVPLGLSVSVCIRVGNCLGSGNTTAASTSSKAALIMIAVWSFGVGLVVIAIKNVFPYVFTDNSSLTSLASSLLPIMCLLQLGDAIQCVGSGVIFGCGRQGIGAVIHLVTYYCIATPLSAILMFLTPLRIHGTWWGLVICTTCQAVTFTFLILLTDWGKATAQAKKRCHENDNFVDETETDTGVVGRDEGRQYSNQGSELDSADHPSVSTSDTDQINSPHLTTKQLIVRRLSALATCLLFLAAGIVLHISLGQTDPAHSSCILVSGSEVNQTWLSFQLHHRESFQKMSAEDQRLLNMTFWYEMTHHWNKTFLYCGDTIEEPDYLSPRETFNLTKLYSHLSMVSRPSG